MAATPPPDQPLGRAIFFIEDFFFHRWHLLLAVSFLGSLDPMHRVVIAKATLPSNSALWVPGVGSSLQPFFRGGNPPHR